MPVDGCNGAPLQSSESTEPTTIQEEILPTTFAQSQKEVSHCHRSLGPILFTPTGPAKSPPSPPSVPSLANPGPRWYASCLAPVILLTLFTGIDAAVLAVMQSGSNIMYHAAWSVDQCAELILRNRFPDSVFFNSLFEMGENSPLAVARRLMTEAGTPVPQLLILANPPSPDQGAHKNAHAWKQPQFVDTSFARSLSV